MEYDHGGGRRVRRKIAAGEVISKLKDDGDFDALRLNLIRRLKDNEDLRNNIILAVKQSEALNRPEAENMKPRQLSDAIFEEIGVKVTGQISDGIWTVLRSSDGMKSEICKTVESVCHKLLNPEVEEAGQSSAQNHTSTLGSQEANGCLPIDAANEDTFSDAEPNEPPGFSFKIRQQELNTEDEHDEHEEMPREVSPNGHNAEDPHAMTHLPQLKRTISPPPPASVPAPAATVDNNQRDDDVDDDPDIPPGFG